MRRTWKLLIISFWVVLLIVVFTPSSVNQGAVHYLHMALSISLVIICIALIILPAVIILANRVKLGLAKTVCCLLFLLFFNVMGSIALYFYLKNQTTGGTETVNQSV